MDHVGVAAQFIESVHRLPHGVDSLHIQAEKDTYQTCLGAVDAFVKRGGKEFDDMVEKASNGTASPNVVLTPSAPISSLSSNPAEPPKVKK